MESADVENTDDVAQAPLHMTFKDSCRAALTIGLCGWPQAEAETIIALAKQRRWSIEKERFERKMNEALQK
jgi:hypothetical protein